MTISMAAFSTSFLGSIRDINNVKSTPCSFPSSGFTFATPYFPGCKTTRWIVVSARFKGTHMREKKLAEMIESKVTEAKEVCAGDEGSDECKVAWDEVEEISQAKAHLRVKLEHEEDPLEAFCFGNPETEECSVCED